MSHYLWQLRPYFRQVAGQLLLGSLAGMIVNTLVILPPLLLGWALDTTVAFQRGLAPAAAVGQAVLALIGSALLTETARALKLWWLMTANARIQSNLRADLVRGIFALPVEQLHQTPIGDLMARVIGDVEVLGTSLRQCTVEIWDTLLFTLSMVLAMLLLDARLAASTLAPIPLALLLAHATGRRVRAQTRQAREANAALTTRMQELLAGVRLLRLFGRSQAAIAHVAAHSHAATSANRHMVLLRAGLQPLYQLLITSGIVMLVWQGGAQVVAGSLTIGTFVAFLQFYGRLVGRAFRIPQLVNALQSGRSTYERLQPFLAPAVAAAGEPRGASLRAGQIAGSTQPPPTQPPRQRQPVGVTLRDVTARYPGASIPALAGLTLTIAPGTLIAVTGPVGAGKSALAQALIGLLPLERGQVLLDGQPPQASSGTALVGFLPQESFLFSGTIRENIMLTDPDTRPTAAQAQTVQLAVELAALPADLHVLPEGLASTVGEGGVRVSGGQRQRIALARAVAAHAPTLPGLLVLDDPFSAADVRTEAQIIAALRAAFGPQAPAEQRATVVVCSHRLAAFPTADQIIVLDAGRIVEQGSHAALLAAGMLYARIYRAQQHMDSSPVAEVL